MLGWLFKPSCPCDLSAKDWIEARLEWLAGQFDESAFAGGPVVQPTPEFFPDAYDGSRESVRTLLDRVCGYLGIDPAVIRLDLFHDSGAAGGLVNAAGQEMGTTVGTYHMSATGPVLRLNKSRLGDPMLLVGTMAHELSHYLLLGERRRHGDEFDNELITDLTAVHLGMGIFLANKAGAMEGRDTYWPDTPLRKPEYMTPPMYGWALAHLAWFRNEDRPAWAKHLTSGARANLRQGLRYLHATADTWYRPARLKKGP